MMGKIRNKTKQDLLKTGTEFLVILQELNSLFNFF